MEGLLGELRRSAVLIHGTPVKDRQIIAALGMAAMEARLRWASATARRRTPPWNRLLSELVERGLAFSKPRLCILQRGC
jgi:hypothetical protein